MANSEFSHSCHNKVFVRIFRFWLYQQIWLWFNAQSSLVSLIYINVHPYCWWSYHIFVMLNGTLQIWYQTKHCNKQDRQIPSLAIYYVV